MKYASIYVLNIGNKNLGEIERPMLHAGSIMEKMNNERTTFTFYFSITLPNKTLVYFHVVVAI